MSESESKSSPVETNDNDADLIPSETTPAASEAEAAAEPTPEGAPDIVSEPDASKAEADSNGDTSASPAAGSAAASEHAAEPAAEKSPAATGVVRKRPIKGDMVKDLKAGQPVAGVFVLRHVDFPLDRQGKPFLVGAIADASGRVEARMWGIDATDHQDLCSGVAVKIEGHCATFQSRLQVRLDSIEVVDAVALGLKSEDLVSEAGRSPEEMFEQLDRLIRSIKDPTLADLLKRVFQDPEVREGLRSAPAALSVHHAWRGGLLEHTLGCASLVDKSCGLYPQINRDLAVTGGLLHDLGKLDEFEWKGPMAYSSAGRLMGHLVLGASRVGAVLDKMEAVPLSLREQLLHIMISHHGEAAHGSAKPPMTLEALIVHLSDLTDARIASWTELLDTAGTSGWTDYSRFYDRPLFKGDTVGKRKRPRRRRGGATKDRPSNRTVPTREDDRRARDRGNGAPRSRSDGPKRRPSASADRPRRDRGRGEASSKEGRRRSQGPARGRAREDRGDRGDRGARANPKAEETATLTFNPFAKLSAEAPAPAPAEVKNTQVTEPTTTAAATQPTAATDTAASNDKS